MELQDIKYNEFFTDIKQRIIDAQYSAMKSVTKEQIQLYWNIGKSIVVKQKELGWGKSIVEKLAKDLQNEFIGQSGWSSGNLWLMRQFYSLYHNNVNLQPLVAEIGWTHNVLVFTKCKDELEREFYIRMTQKYGWSKNVLTHQIEGNLKLLDK